MSTQDTSVTRPAQMSPPMQEAWVSVSIWFDMQPDAANGSVVPLWARQLAHAQVDGQISLIAHPDSVYAKMGLVCDIANEELWPNEAWTERLARAIASAKSKKIRQLILLMPHRSAPALWGQWALLHLGQFGSGLDNLTGLLQGIKGWEDALHRLDASRWLMMDQVMTYGLTRADFLVHMRAFNPMARWIHEGFNDHKLLLQPINAYHRNVPMARMPIKNDDLAAWGVNKVVYFATSNDIDRVKVMGLFDKWREKYSQKIVKLWGVVRIRDVGSPLLVSSVHHLWASNVMSNFSLIDCPENRFWILGENLDAAQLQAEFEQCIA